MVSLGWPHRGEDDGGVNGGPSENNDDVILGEDGLSADGWVLCLWWSPQRTGAPTSAKAETGSP